MNSTQGKAFERMGLNRPQSPDAVSDFDRWIVIDNLNNVIEGASTEQRAFHAAHILNEHAHKHGHPRTYTIRLIEA